MDMTTDKTITAETGLSESLFNYWFSLHFLSLYLHNLVGRDCDTWYKWLKCFLTIKVMQVMKEAQVLKITNNLVLSAKQGQL